MRSMLLGGAMLLIACGDTPSAFDAHRLDRPQPADSGVEQQRDSRALADAPMLDALALDSKPSMPDTGPDLAVDAATLPDLVQPEAAPDALGPDVAVWPDLIMWPDIKPALDLQAWPDTKAWPDSKVWPDWKLWPDTLAWPDLKPWPDTKAWPDLEPPCTGPCDDGKNCTSGDTLSLIGGACTCLGKTYSCMVDPSISNCVQPLCDGKGGCTYSQKPGTCYTPGGACAGNGQANPNNPCVTCSGGKWAAIWGYTFLGDGRFCSLAQKCYSVETCLGGLDGCRCTCKVAADCSALSVKSCISGFCR